MSTPWERKVMQFLREIMDVDPSESMNGALVKRTAADLLHAFYNTEERSQSMPNDGEQLSGVAADLAAARAGAVLPDPEPMCGNYANFAHRSGGMTEHTCTLAPGHGAYHTDGVRSWGMDVGAPGGEFTGYIRDGNVVRDLYREQGLHRDQQTQDAVLTRKHDTVHRELTGISMSFAARGLIADKMAPSNPQGEFDEMDELRAATYAPTVDHPPYYGGDTTYEAIKVIDAWGLGFSLGNAVKYIARSGRKHPTVEGHTRDLRKAVWYIEHFIKTMQDNHATNGDTGEDDE